MLSFQNLPNIISLSRGLILSPLFIIVVYFIQLPNQEQVQFYFILGWIILFTSLVSDILDGNLARHFKTTSDLGVYLDPLMDKLFINSAYLFLIIWSFLPTYHLIIFVIWILRDIIIIYLRSTKKGSLVKEPFLLAKAKTFFQGILLSLILFSFSVNGNSSTLHANSKNLVNLSILVLTIIITSLIIFTFFEYLWKFFSKH